MKIVIEIPDEAVKTDNIANDFITYFECCTPKLFETLKNGTPLPKGHGRLVDIDKIDDDRMESDNPIIELTVNREYIEAISLDYLNSLPTIIEADKEGE